MTLKDKHIVVIDDTIAIRSFLRILLEGHGARCSEASTADEGVALCQRDRPDLVVLDLGLPDRDGLDVLPEIAESLSNVVVLTVRKESKDAALERGASAFITKPFIMDDLLEAINDHMVPPRLIA